MVRPAAWFRPGRMETGASPPLANSGVLPEGGSPCRACRHQHRRNDIRRLPTRPTRPGEQTYEHLRREQPRALLWREREHSCPEMPKSRHRWVLNAARVG
jgi:hypothetical protein